MKPRLAAVGVLALIVLFVQSVTANGIGSQE